MMNKSIFCYLLALLVALPLDGMMQLVGNQLQATITQAQASPDTIFHTQFQISLPGQNAPISLDGSVSYTPPSTLTVQGTIASDAMYGPPAFGIPGLALGNFGMQANIDLTQVVFGSAALAISDYALSGSVALGSTVVDCTAEINATTSANMILSGSASTISVQDLATFAVNLAGNTGQTQAVLGALSYLPNISFSNMQVIIAAQNAQLFGQSYQKGISCNGTLTFADISTDCLVIVNDAGFQGTAALNNTQLGPVLITGFSNGQNSTQIPAGLVLSLDIGSVLAKLCIEGGIALDIMDGVNAGTQINITSQGLNAQFQTQVFFIFNASCILSAQGDITDPANYTIQTDLDGLSCTQWTQLLMDVAQLFLKSPRRSVFADIVHWSQSELEKLQDAVQNLLTKGFSITQASFTSRITDLQNGVLPIVTIQGIFAGKPKIVQIPVNFKDHKATFLALIDALK